MTTNIEYALMAGAAYFSNRGDINQFPIPQGWTELESERRANGTTGFEARTFQSGSEIVISYAGTDFTTKSPFAPDMRANFALGTGAWSIQLLQAAEYYLRVKAANSGVPVTLTGHSLGGGLASLVGVFFGVPTKAFDQAPFEAAAGNLSTNAATLKALLAAKLNADGSRLYSETALAPLTEYIGLLPGNLTIPRSSLVDTVRVEGELLDGGLAGARPIGNRTTTLTHGPGAGPIDLHSQALLVAFLQSNQTAPTENGTVQSLTEASKKLASLMEMFFDSKLFSFSTAVNSPDRNLLEHLVRHESGVRDPVSGVTSIPADAMLTRFTSDLWKIAQDGGLTLNDGSSAKHLTNALTAFAMQFYYQNSANAQDAQKQLFNQVNGGISFDIANVSTTFAKAFASALADNTGNGKLNLKDAKGFDQYLKNYLTDRSVFTAAESALIQSLLPQMRDWLVQAGTPALTGIDTLNRGAFMLGGTGVDTLVGGSKTDLLVGNTGDDLLEGRGGSDMLLGGRGNDTYLYKTDLGDSGLDTILDSDNTGRIIIGTTQLSNATQLGDNRTYKDSDGRLYTLVNASGGSGGGGSTNRLLINGNFVVENFTSGSLGISLNGPQAFYNPATSNDILGDLAPKDADPNTAGIQIERDTLGNIVVGTSPETGRVDTLKDSTANDYISSGAGNDIIIQAAGGDDHIRTGAGRDWVSGVTGPLGIPAHSGLGRDVIEGGSEADVLLGGLGDDRLFADELQTVQAAITAGNAISGGSTQLGDWLAGNAGDDVLVGAAARDALFGGAGADLLVGGLGDDYLGGDVDWTPLSLDWTVRQVNGLLTFLPFTGTDHPADFGADVVYAGAGDDFGWGGRGNDVLFGEAGADQLSGNGDNDALFGGAGRDLLHGDGIEISGEAESFAGDDYLDGGAMQDVYVFKGGFEIASGTQSSGLDLLALGLALERCRHRLKSKKAAARTPYFRKYFVFCHKYLKKSPEKISDRICTKYFWIEGRAK